MTASTYAGITSRTNVYAADKMLEHAKPVMVLEKLGTPLQMPKNKTDTVKFRRPDVFTAATAPLVEGVTPTAKTITFTDVSAVLKEYGEVYDITSVIEDLHEDPIGSTIAMMAGENIGRTMEALNFGIVKAGSNVFFANGTQRDHVNTPVTLAKMRAVGRALKAQKAQKITRILDGSNNYATKPCEAAFVAVCHTDIENDIRNLPGFIPTANYGTWKTISEHEFGSVEEFRFISSSDLGPWTDGGAAKAGSGTLMVSTTGTNADVYPILTFGQDAWGHVALRGYGAISPSIIPVGQKTKDDPLGQIGKVGWKTYWAALITNQAWLARLEVSATAL